MKKKPISELKGIFKWWRNFKNKRKLKKLAKKLDYTKVSF